MSADTALQDRIWPDNHCWGCGPANPEGLRVKSRPDGADILCVFQPRPEHAAGPRHVVNGGILATIVDCHSVWTAVAALYRAEGRDPGSEPPIWCVTATLRIDYLAPTPIGLPIELRARPREVSGRKVLVECEARSGAELTARAELLALRVPLDWLERSG